MDVIKQKYRDKISYKMQRENWCSSISSKIKLLTMVIELTAQPTIGPMVLARRTWFDSKDEIALVTLIYVLIHLKLKSIANVYTCWNR